MTDIISARIGETHGYRFDGDSVQLNAELVFSDAALAAGRHWALQLWASSNGFPQQQVAGVKVAELMVFPMAGLLSAVAEVPAMPPAGTDDQQMALALVSWMDEGVAEVDDLVVFPHAEAFVQPRLSGNVACVLADDTASLRIDAIENPRAADNISGTLALEVWALDAPYGGGSWQGVPVASLILGVLAGGNSWTACDFTVPAAVPTGESALTVMLREWTPAGYVTRDYRNLDVGQAVAAVVQEVPASKARPVAKANPAAKAKVPGKLEKTAPALKRVAVNTASEAEMLALKGMGTTVVRAIIAARPYKSLDDLCRAKGMGPKLLARLRDQFVL